MIDFSTLKELYVDGKKITSLFLDGHEVPFGEEPVPEYAYQPLTYLLMSANDDWTLDIYAQNDDGYTVDDGSFEYRVGDNRQWEAWQTYTGPVNIDQSYYQVQIRASASQQSQFYNFQIRFYYTATSNPVQLYQVSGNIFSLIDYNNGWENGDLPEAESTIDNQFASLFSYGTLQQTVYGASQLWLPEVKGEYAYSNLFNGSGLQEAPVLRAKTLTDGVYSYMFYGCSITTPPELPATVLADKCYSHMFEECQQLTAAPVLPADEMMPRCYEQMFRGCISLTAAPELPATVLDENCYNAMFLFCSSLTSAPDLPATAMEANCYKNMFNECTKLRIPPVLCAQNLADNCFDGMFQNCSSLTAMPAIPSTDIVPEAAMRNMFYGCKNLRSSATVSLPALSVEDSGYEGMFRDCTYLTKTPQISAEYVGYRACYYMFNSCSNLTSATDLPATTISPYCYANMFQGCTRLVYAAQSLPATTLKDCCYDHMFQRCLVLKSPPAISATTAAISSCSYMFASCRQLSSAPDLPATTLAKASYNYMFDSCSSIVSPPAISATTLADSCYYGMFAECKSLTAAPELPATTLCSNCYHQMFSDCSSIVSPPVLSATNIAYGCYYGMFAGCKSLTAAPELPATTLADVCYYQMFYDCSSLTSAPELPAKTLKKNCYYSMFSGCSSLKSISVGFLEWNPQNATQLWTFRVSSSGTFICPEALGTNATIQRGNNYCPTGWTVVNSDAAPVPLKFTAEQANSTVALSAFSSAPTVSLLSSIDGETWASYTVNSIVTLANVAAGSDPNDPNDIPADTDGDGFTDYDEQQAGTDPNDPDDNPGVVPDPEEPDPEEPDPEEEP